MAGDHGTPLVTMTSLPSTVLDTGDDNIILANFMWEEAMRSSVRVLDEAGELDGFERLGVFGPLEPGMQEAVDDGLEPALEEAGTEIAVDGLIPFGVPVDNAAVAAVVSRFKSEDVDAVFAVGSFFYNGAFMTEAERQDYHPTYVMSDMSEGTDDLILAFAPARAARQRHRGELEGQGARAGADRGGPDVHRHLRPRRPGIGHPGERRGADLRAPRLIRQGLEGAGDTPTRGGFVEAMEGIGDFTTSGGGQGSYGPDNHTMPDQVRLVRFDLEGCQCWAFEGDWIDVDG